MMTLAAAIGLAIFFGVVCGMFFYGLGANDDDY